MLVLFTLMHYRALTDAFYSLSLYYNEVTFFAVKKIEFFLFSTKKWKKIETAAGNPYFLPTLLLVKIEMMMRR